MDYFSVIPTDLNRNIMLYFPMETIYEIYTKFWVSGGDHTKIYSKDIPLKCLTFSDDDIIWLQLIHRDLGPIRTKGDRSTGDRFGQLKSINQSRRSLYFRNLVLYHYYLQSPYIGFGCRHLEIEAPLLSEKLAKNSNMPYPFPIDFCRGAESDINWYIKQASLQNLFDVAKFLIDNFGHNDRRLNIEYFLQAMKMKNGFVMWQFFRDHPNRIDHLIDAFVDYIGSKYSPSDYDNFSDVFQEVKILMERYGTNDQVEAFDSIINQQIINGNISMMHALSNSDYRLNLERVISILSNFEMIGVLDVDILSYIFKQIIKEKQYHYLHRLIEMGIASDKMKILLREMAGFITASFPNVYDLIFEEIVKNDQVNDIANVYIVKLDDLIAIDKAIKSNNITNSHINHETIIRELLLNEKSSSSFVLSLLKDSTRKLIKLSHLTISDLLQFGLQNDLAMVDFLIDNQLLGEKDLLYLQELGFSVGSQPSSDNRTPIFSDNPVGSLSSKYEDIDEMLDLMDDNFNDDNYDNYGDDYDDISDD